MQVCKLRIMFILENLCPHSCGQYKSGLKIKEGKFEIKMKRQA